MEWFDMESAPRTGSPILLTNGHEVCVAWYKGDDPYPWVIVDKFVEQVSEDGMDFVEVNSAMEAWPEKWAKYPLAPEQ